MDPVAVIAAGGGVLRGADLIASGARRRELGALVASGQLTRPRNGWYSTLPLNHPRFRAARIGGRLTGASALADMGAWMLQRPRRLEVAVVRGSARLRSDPDSVIHWVEDRGVSMSPAVVGLAEALIRVTLDHDLEVSVPCWDWALFTGRLDRIAFERALLRLPRSARGIRHWLDAESQSVLESVARVRLLRGGWPVRSQVRVGEVSAIDLVLADSVALELDGREHHEASFESDRRKDLAITIEGRHSIRLTYSMLIGDWPLVELAIAAALRARGLSHVQNSVTPPPEPVGTRCSPGQRNDE